jgi:hypothetical protein
MADYADLLRAEQSNPSAALLQMLVSDYTQYDVIAAIEGDEDKIFYFDFLRAYMAGRSIIYLPCGGKPAVLGLKTLVDEYDWGTPPKIAYLCDKDFDDYIGALDRGVFYTQGYSIESYFSCRDYAAYVLEKFSSGTMTAAQRSAIEDDFEAILLGMVREVRPIAALMIELRADGSHPDFSSLSVNDFFDLTNSPPSKRLDRWARVRAAWCGDAGVPLRRVMARARQLRPEEYMLWLRGKLGLQLARAAFRLAVHCAPEGLRTKAPDAAMFGAEAFRSAREFIGEIPTLRDYCQTLH